MGKYINETSNGPIGASFQAKCKALLEDGATQVQSPISYQPNMVCVVDNGMFAAAGYMYSEHEFQSFNNPSDSRPRAWFVWDKVEQFAK